MTDWDPLQPMVKRRSFKFLFRRYIRNGKPSSIREFLIQWARTSGITGSDGRPINVPSLSDEDWKTLTTRFKKQLKFWIEKGHYDESLLPPGHDHVYMPMSYRYGYKDSWRLELTTVASSDSGFLNDNSLMGMKIKQHYPRSMYEGIIIDISQKKILGGELSASLYTIKLNNNDKGHYTIYKSIESQKTTYFWILISTGRIRAFPIELLIPKPCKDQHQKLCIACTTSCVDTVFLNCGHACMCSNCAKRTNQRSGKCPMCRQPIVKIQKMFYVGTDP